MIGTEAARDNGSIWFDDGRPPVAATRAVHSASPIRTKAAQ